MAPNPGIKSMPELQTPVSRRLYTKSKSGLT